MKLRWNPLQSLKKEGILTGCDDKQEWMLKWWWKNYSKQNTFPVTFFDFGMSKSARLWCENRGSVIPLHLSDSIIADKSQVTRPWSITTTDFAWSKRKAWFSKPLSLLKTPYQKTVWLDIDCRVKGNLESLFAFCEKAEGLALGREIPARATSEKAAGLVPDQGICYNTGVIAFMHRSPLIENWARHAFFNNQEALGDQDLLSRLLFEGHHTPYELPSIYNRIHPEPDTSDVLIYHHASLAGKMSIEVTHG